MTPRVGFHEHLSGAENIIFEHVKARKGVENAEGGIP